MPVSAPIKFFDASPISFSNEIFVFSPHPLPFPRFEKGRNLYRSPGSCALKSRKESANRRGGGEGDRDRNGYFALSTSWPTVLFTTGSLSAKTMRLERSLRKEREKERYSERKRKRERESKRKTRKNCGTKPRAYTFRAFFPGEGGEGNSYSLLLLLSRMDHAVVWWKVGGGWL